MEHMGSKETMFFDPTTGKLHTSKPSAANPDQVVAIKMNDPESGGFFGTNQLKEQEMCVHTGIPCNAIFVGDTALN